jgi:hypothetical protein
VLSTFLYGADMGYVCVWVSDAISTTGNFRKNVLTEMGEVIEHAWGLTTVSDNITRSFEQFKMNK